MIEQHDLKTWRRLVARDIAAGRWDPFRRLPDAELDRPGRPAFAGQWWWNNLYSVTIAAQDTEAYGTIRVLMVRRHDEGEPIPWDHLQRIKDELAGPTVEAVEFFPHRAHLVNVAAMRHLWCLPRGTRLPFGWGDGRPPLTRRVDPATEPAG